ncbi:hypothetical protein IB234_15310 [Pseudomonas sp. PDM16]|uniref:hypothetical protein n=1 Tax=Pseudomonas sp. PDM16 TaxID=2769292 RepID=UPI0017826C16|nr:hypothetical protein [Pseudomonas sp. PDM16]MBD9415930.1 hypothetical protein [Pseudomonas sp. PDM16]
MKQLYINTYASALVGAINASVTVLVVASAAGMPVLAAGEFFLLTLVGFDANGNEVRWEIVKVTARSGATLTIERNQELSGAYVWPDGTLIEARFTAGTAAEFLKRGDFGIGSPALVNGMLSTLNDLTLSAGLYGYGGSTPGAPNGLPGIVQVLPYSSAAVRQIARPVSGSSDVVSVFERQLRAGPVYGDWAFGHTSASQFSLGATKVTALEALGISDLPARVEALESSSGGAGQEVTNLGAVATSAAQTVELNIGEGRFFSASMDAANATGALTLNFTSVPVSATEVTTWHVELLRGGRKTVAFQLDGAALTPVWSGGGAPTLNNATGSRDLLMFYRMPGRSSIYAMLVDSGVA